MPDKLVFRPWNKFSGSYIVDSPKVVIGFIRPIRGQWRYEQRMSHTTEQLSQVLTKMEQLENDDPITPLSLEKNDNA